MVERQPETPLTVGDEVTVQGQGAVDSFAGEIAAVRSDESGVAYRVTKVVDNQGNAHPDIIMGAAEWVQKRP